MEYRKLGRTDLQVSPLCLGIMSFGPQTNEVGSFRIMDTLLELGLNYCDRANLYGGALWIAARERDHALDGAVRGISPDLPGTGRHGTGSIRVVASPSRLPSALGCTILHQVLQGGATWPVGRGHPAIVQHPLSDLDLCAQQAYVAAFGAPLGAVLGRTS